MKKPFIIAVLILGSCFLFLSQSNAQSDTLTMGQIFNLKVGDTLIYTGYEDVEALTISPPYIVYYGQWGFTIDNIDTAEDTITFHYLILNTALSGELVIYHPDSTVLCPQVLFSFVQDERMFRWYGQGVSLSHVTTRDSGMNAPYWYMAASLDSGVDNRIANKVSIQYFESGEGYIFLQGVGILQGINSGDGYFNYEGGTPGGGVLQLIYYHSGSTIWMDTLDYNLSDGISNIRPAQTNFKLYPNPTADAFYLQAASSNFDGKGIIQIYNLQSQLVFQQPFEPGKSIQKINASNLSPGMYVVGVEDEQGVYVWRGRVVKM